MKVLKWVAIVIVGLIVIGALLPGDEDGGDSDSGQEVVQDSENNGSAESASQSPRERVRVALAAVEGPVEDPEVKAVEFGRAITVTATTPEGGFEGASTSDLDTMASAIFRAVYGEAAWRRTGTIVVFKGGLVSTDTGKDLPDVNTGIYTVKRGEARQIDWSDSDAVEFNIDWSNYRDFAHPALKQD